MHRFGGQRRQQDHFLRHVQHRRPPGLAKNAINLMSYELSIYLRNATEFPTFQKVNGFVVVANSLHRSLSAANSAPSQPAPLNKRRMAVGRM
jgi:hypothetical protein